jgi:Ser/Thr protein kinase RdoA (MazF antagonist)
MEPADELLAGGGINVVLRRGDTVLRPRGPHSERVNRLLGHLADAGFDGAPRHLGVDDEDREVLTYLPGTVSSSRPGPEGLVSAARLLRRYHDATMPVAGSWPGGWMLPDRAPAEVICHGDVAPYNCVFDGPRAVGLIDFDTAHPGPRLRDVAYAVYRFAPLSHLGPAEVQLQRAAMFCDAYGDLDRTGLLEALVVRLRELITFMHAQATAGNSAFARHIARGDDLLYERDIMNVQAGTYASLT